MHAGVITTQHAKLNTETIHATLTIDYGNGILQNYEVELSNATVYSLLMKASVENNFEVVAEYYEQYQSHYIESINNTNEGNGIYWQYYINGEYGMLGADMQPVYENDMVKWVYQKAQI